MTELTGDQANTLYKSIKDDITNPDNTATAEDVLSFYRTKVAQKIQGFDALYQKDKMGKQTMLLKNLKETQNKNDFQNAQNESTKVAFLERYLFLIVKILLFLVCICVFLYIVRDQLSLGQTIETIQNQASLLKKQTNDSIQKAISKTNGNTNTVMNKI